MMILTKVWRIWVLLGKKKRLLQLKKDREKPKEDEKERNTFKKSTHIYKISEDESTKKSAKKLRIPLKKMTVLQAHPRFLKRKRFLVKKIKQNPMLKLLQIQMKQKSKPEEMKTKQKAETRTRDEGKAKEHKRTTKRQKMKMQLRLQQEQQGKSNDSQVYHQKAATKRKTPVKKHQQNDHRKNNRQKKTTKKEN